VLPATLAEVLLARVQGLSEQARQVLRVAAVAGRRVPHRLLAEVAGQPEAELERGLHEAVGSGVLTSDAAAGGYAFRHALLQEAVYGDLLPGEQMRLHDAYARRLAADPDGAAAELAHHYLASHDLVGALAASVRAPRRPPRSSPRRRPCGTWAARCGCGIGWPTRRRSPAPTGSS